VIQLQDVMDTWNWDTPPPHAVPAICHVSEHTATIYAAVVIIPIPVNNNNNNNNKIFINCNWVVTRWQ